MKALSVVITMYNQVQNIERAIKSVQRQALKVNEIIVVDDGSTDGSVELVRNLNVENLNVVELSGCGIATMRNEGAMAAKSNYVAFLGADDEWLPFFTHEMSQLQEKYPTSDVFATRYQCMSDNGTLRDADIYLNSVNPNGYLLTDFFKMATLGDLPFTVSSMMVKRSNFLALGGFAVSEHTRVPKDFILQAALDGTIAYSPNIHMHCHTQCHNPGVEDLFPVGNYSSAERLYSMVMAGNYSAQMLKSVQRYCAVQGLNAAKTFIKNGNSHMAKSVLTMPMCQHYTRYYLAMFTLVKLHAAKSLLSNAVAALRKESQA
ncbi:MULTISPECIES: glycosyltransferase family 2 protein [unclassified Alteromonas]|uniref:glycosyltransferase family 2 protein n=1 Tax=unclassified Alteromonas TaxID=2614992 RepID=UPI001921F3F3|nr:MULTISPECIES: glycosyltransferase family 2 protein [unclassified Alteromonas]WDT85322.1 glycosyltransferase family 2 protein [Alteromonas sp. 009811495]BCO20254.1 hypothetical protein KUC3_31110 [Alteromonas sp. KC3]BCO24220.1 hypothetical protein KUC14_30890 [Alteromonas sp. KC14]